MRIGLVRHFKVKKELPKKIFISRDELYSWFKEYDAAVIEEGECDLCGIDWKKCYASDLPRALKTAQTIFDGDIISLNGLREFQPLLLFKSNMKLPILLWIILPRIKQLMSTELTAEFKEKIVSSLDEILTQSKEDTLIVSHGFSMIFLKKELIKRGFKGVNFHHPSNGKLYIFER